MSKLIRNACSFLEMGVGGGIVTKSRLDHSLDIESCCPLGCALAIGVAMLNES